MSALRIGIDARAATEVPAGRGRVVRELLRALAARDPEEHRYLLYARRAWKEATLDPARFTWREIGARDPLWHLRTARAANRECDVFLSTNSYLTGWFTRVPFVPIVHDLLAFDPAMRPNRRSALIERVTLGPALRRAAALIANSQATADALRARFPASAGRTRVALLGARADAAGTLSLQEAARLPADGFVLAVGTLEPRKNLPRLVAAYATLGQALQREHPLVVVGAVGWEAGPTLAAVRSLGERCVQLGYVSDETLAELYTRCAVFCYPSLGEGFGLPVLEAMAYGAPVLTSAVAALEEVGGDAVEYVDPRDHAAIAAGLRRLLRDDRRRSELRELARRRAGTFSWRSFADAVLDVLDQAASRRS